MSDRFDVAASYLARMLSRPNSPAMQSEMDEWEEATPENQEALERVFSAWDVAGSAQDAPEIQQMLADMRQRTEPRRHGWLYGTSGKWAMAAGLAVMLSASVAIWFGHEAPGTGRVRSAAAPAAAPSLQMVRSGSERRTIRLPDGSRITLDRDSMVQLAYSQQQRSVSLHQGRAHFAVHKDPSRPFVVAAGRLTATAVGTAFDVRLSDRGEEVMTSEGVVRVVTRLPARDGLHATLLNAGMKLVQNSDAVKLMSVDILQEIAWTDGKIVFSSQCLGDVARQMNPHAATPLVVSADAARIAISGVFELDNAQGLAQALEQQGLVSTRREGGRIFVSRASADAPDDCRSAA